jgi:multicomponent Na+:H+ antiporter subunit C
MIPYLFCIVLAVVGLYAIVAKKNLVKIIVGLAIVEYAVNMFLVLTGYRPGRGGSGNAPILAPGANGNLDQAGAVDAVPQALILTSIVIGLGLVALMVAMAIRLYEKYKTFDITEMRKLRG